VTTSGCQGSTTDIDRGGRKRLFPGEATARQNVIKKPMFAKSCYLVAALLSVHSPGRQQLLSPVHPHFEHLET
jgi:hypothetical protein